MAKTWFGKKPLVKKSKRLRTNSRSNKLWSRLDDNVMSKILMLLPPDELFLSTSLVCRSWRTLTWEVLFWKNNHTIDLTSLRYIIRRTSCAHIPVYKIRKSIEYSKTLCTGINTLALSRHVLGSEQSVTSIVFPRNMYLTGLEDLTSIAMRSLSVKKLVLKDAYALQDGCFSEALKYWKSLEELSIGPVITRHMTHIIKELSFHCKNIHTLHIKTNYWIDQDNVFTLNGPNSKLMATHLQLKTLSVTKGWIHKDGVAIILNECKQLLNLHIDECHAIHGSILLKHVKTARIRKQVLTFTSRKCIKWSLESEPPLLFTSDEVVRHLFS